MSRMDNDGPYPMIISPWIEDMLRKDAAFGGVLYVSKLSPEILEKAAAIELRNREIARQRGEAPGEGTAIKAWEEFKASHPA